MISPLYLCITVLITFLGIIESDHSVDFIPPEEPSINAPRLESWQPTIFSRSIYGPHVMVSQ